MATALSVPERAYNAGQNFGPTTFDIPAGTLEMQIVLTNPSGWPLGDIAALSFDLSYDGGASWVAMGGMTVNGDAQGLEDMFTGIVSGAKLKARFPQAANANTRGRAQASILKTFTTAISVTTV